MFQNQKPCGFHWLSNFPTDLNIFFGHPYIEQVIKSWGFMVHTCSQHLMPHVSSLFWLNPIIHQEPILVWVEHRTKIWHQQCTWGTETNLSASQPNHELFVFDEKPGHVGVSQNDVPENFVVSNQMDNVSLIWGSLSLRHPHDTPRELCKFDQLPLNCPMNMHEAVIQKCFEIHGMMLHHCIEEGIQLKTIVKNLLQSANPPIS